MVQPSISVIISIIQMYRRLNETNQENFKLIFIFMSYTYDTSESFSPHLPSVLSWFFGLVKLTSVTMTIGIVGRLVLKSSTSPGFLCRNTDEPT